MLMMLQELNKDAYLYTINRDPLLKNLKGDSRYKEFLRKMNFPE
jgi:hypothetical protein